MITRGIGLAAASIGGGFFLSGLTKFLIFIPVIGSIINRITGLLGFVLGLLLGLITLLLAFITSHPLALAGVITLLGLGLFALIKNASNKRKKMQQHVVSELGRMPNPRELAELEYIKLYQLFAGDGKITPKEQKRLGKIAKKNKWSSNETVALQHRAIPRGTTYSITEIKDQLDSLIRYTLADGQIDRQEMKVLELAAAKHGLRQGDLSTRIAKIQRS